MKGGFGNIMKQAQQMQGMIEQKQRELANTEVTGESGAGLVKIVMTCTHAVKSVFIDPSLLEEDPEVLGDLVAASFNDAVRKAEKVSRELMASVTAGLNLPAGFKDTLGGE